MSSFIVYGAEGCSNCKIAVSILKQKQKEYVYKVLSVDYQVEELMDVLPKPSRELPQVFELVEGNVMNYIGSLKELVNHLKC